MLFGSESKTPLTEAALPNSTRQALELAADPGAMARRIFERPTSSRERR